MDYLCNMNWRPVILSVLVGLLTGAGALCAQELTQLSLNTITDAVGSGQYSGITYLGGSHYAVVHDKLGGGGILFFTIQFREDGTVAYVGKTVPEGTIGPGGLDNEGVAYVPATRTLFVSAEADQSIREYDLKGRPTGRSLAVPAHLGIDCITPNMGFEALTYNPETHLFWTVTEGPLKGDDSLTLRLQSFGDDLLPALCCGYRMDAPRVPQDASAQAAAYVHGVPALAALDDGRLIVLEREVYVPAGSLGDKLNGSFSAAKLYLVTPGQEPVLPKQLLYSFETTPLSSFANSEGMCLGPVLPDGRRMLLLIPDSQDGAGGIMQEYIRVLAF